MVDDKLLHICKTQTGTYSDLLHFASNLLHFKLRVPLSFIVRYKLWVSVLRIGYRIVWHTKINLLLQWLMSNLMLALNFPFVRWWRVIMEVRNNSYILFALKQTLLVWDGVLIFTCFPQAWVIFSLATFIKPKPLKYVAA